MRIEHHGGGVIYVAVDPAGEWARSTQPLLLVLADYDDRDALIGLTLLGPLANKVVERGLVAALDLALSSELIDAIKTRGDAEPRVDRNELEEIRSALRQVEKDTREPALSA